jgi:RimJ/RimL family protein N-acetyltransferase
MVTFERTRDYALIGEIMRHPRVYRHIVDDFAPPRERLEPVRDGRIWYVLARGEEGDPLGLFLFLAQSTVLWECHVCMLPHAWGAPAAEAARAVIPWLWAKTPCRRLVAQVPRTNPLAIRFARAAGLREFGVNERSFLKRGELRDQVLLGISKE